MRMRKGTSAGFWRSFNNQQDQLAKSCFSEQRAASVLTNSSPAAQPLTTHKVLPLEYAV